MPIHTFIPPINQQRGANCLIVLFLSVALVGIILIALQNYFIFYDGRLNDSLDLAHYFIKLFVECFSGILIVIAWLTLIKETRKTGGAPDWGLAWLSLAVLWWCVDDLLNILFQLHDVFYPLKKPLVNSAIDSVTGRIISTVNSFCFLFSLHYLEFSEKSRWKRLRDQFEKVFTVKTTALILLAFIILTIFLGIQFKNSTSFFIYMPDLILSFITTAALWYFFTEYFEQRKIDYMGFFITVVAIVIVLVQMGHLVDTTYLHLFLMEENVPILSMIYRPFLITLFLLVAFSSVRNEKEKQAILERRDMNHAIRGSLHILNHDIKKLSKTSKQSEFTEHSFIIQDLEFRVKAIYDLHNLIHNEYSDEKISLEKYLQQLVENTKYAFEYNDIETQFVHISNLSMNRSLLRKIGTVITELMINATKFSILQKDKLKEGEAATDKLLAIEVINQQGQLQIKVSDNGVFVDNLLTQATTGHGLNLVKRIVEEDFEGSLSVEKNDWRGTTVSIHLPLNNVL